MDVNELAARLAEHATPHLTERAIRAQLKELYPSRKRFTDEHYQEAAATSTTSTPRSSTHAAPPPTYKPRSERTPTRATGRSAPPTTPAPPKTNSRSPPGYRSCRSTTRAAAASSCAAWSGVTSTETRNPAHNGAEQYKLSPRT